MCDLAFSRGVLLVAAAGNSGGPVEHPARYRSVIAVSAIDAANQLAPFSCRGPEVELCAPGVDVLSTVPGGGYARLSGALIPNTAETDRDGYIRMGCAIKAACADDPVRGLEIWHGWCARWAGGSNDPEEVEKRWEGLGPRFSVGADWLYEQAKPFGFNAAAMDFEALEDAPAETAAPAAGGPAPYSHSDLAWRFAGKHQDDIRYVDATGRWHVWDDRRWAEEQTEQTRHLVRKVCDAASQEIKRAKGSAKLARDVASSGTINGVWRTARTDPRIAAAPDLWDADPWISNTPAGVIDWRTGRLLAHTRELFCAKMMSVGPADTPTPRWDQFLDEITQGDRELQAYLQRAAGYCATGSIQEHALFFSWGEGTNGKTVFWNTISNILGDYATTSEMAAFTESSADRHLTELAKLHGVRLTTTSETEGNRYWAEARVKRVTGGDPIAARFMRCDEFVFRPAFKLVVLGNHPPRLRNVDAAWRRRMHMIPFDFTPAVINRKLEEELVPERPGILRWMIAGCLEWQRIGLAPPDAVIGKTAEYFSGEDLIDRWLAEQYERGEQAFTPTKELFENFQEWCHENGEKPPASNWFGRALRGKGLAAVKGGRGYPLKLRAHCVDEFGDGE
jgi:putative DNA primase/helicase